MVKFLKVFFLLLLITAMVWVSTMWRWHTTEADPSGVDMLLHLVLLPLALTAAVLLLIWGGNKLRKALEAPKEPPPPAKATPSPHAEILSTD